MISFPDRLRGVWRAPVTLRIIATEGEALVSITSSAGGTWSVDQTTDGPFDVYDCTWQADIPNYVPLAYVMIATNQRAYTSILTIDRASVSLTSDESFVVFGMPGLEAYHGNWGFDLAVVVPHVLSNEPGVPEDDLEIVNCDFASEYFRPIYDGLSDAVKAVTFGTGVLGDTISLQPANAGVYWADMPPKWGGVITATLRDPNGDLVPLERRFTFVRYDQPEAAPFFNEDGPSVAWTAQDDRLGNGSIITGTDEVVPVGMLYSTKANIEGFQPPQTFTYLNGAELFPLLDIPQSRFERTSGTFVLTNDDDTANASYASQPMPLERRPAIGYVGPSRIVLRHSGAPKFPVTLSAVWNDYTVDVEQADFTASSPGDGIRELVILPFTQDVAGNQVTADIVVTVTTSEEEGSQRAATFTIPRKGATNYPRYRDFVIDALPIDLPLPYKMTCTGTCNAINLGLSKGESE